MATNRFWRLRYEEEHDRGTHTYEVNIVRHRRVLLYMPVKQVHRHFLSQFESRFSCVSPTTTRLTDAMTYRYSQVDVQNSEQMRPQPDINTESTMVRSPAE